MNDILSNAIANIDAQEDSMLQFWRELILLESPSHYKEGVDRVGTLLSRYCSKQLGYHIRFQQDEVYGNCLAACSCPFESFENGIVLSSHMDTVHAVGTFDPVIREDGSYIYGPGAGDCKAGVVMSLMVAKALKTIGYSARPIKLLFAADEESGGPTGRTFYPNELRGADYMFNCESGIAGKLVTGRKSSLITVFKIRGEAAHIGYITAPPKSAIREAALKLLHLEDHSDYDRMTFSGGVIHGGTVATSSPEECELQVNVRIKDASVINEVLDLLKTTAETAFVAGTTCSLEIRGNINPMSERPENIQLCNWMSQESEKLGFGKLESAFVGGASDASYASAMQIPVVCASGPIVEKQHTRDERAYIPSLTERAKIHVATILNHL